MSRLNIAPTKANRLALKRQLEFALEGYDLLEQKRQILVQEWLRCQAELRKAESKLAEALVEAHALLREATLRSGSEALDRVATGCGRTAGVSVQVRHLMGVRWPRVTLAAPKWRPAWGTGEVSVHADLARRGFVEALPWVAAVATLQTAVVRLGRELRRTQRRCNALTRIFIPTYRETMAWLGSTLEERDREFLVILKRAKREKTRV